MTFDAFCKTHHVTPAERRALLMHLAVYRALRTLACL